ncbi:hypothetical protein BKA56DRAFT_680322 [Ilyonectria sp. MPI-CAGE-AT-0026]|nr:hypothetical protein BKA56DRAFT_680322 [Ilyonectria sp. MPI-CAGE-AT-0026]
MDSPLPRELAPLSSVMSTDGAALHTAIEANQTKVVEILLKRSNCNPNMQINGALGYAITITCFLGRDRIVDMLLAVEPSADVNVVGEVGSALAIACARRTTDIFVRRKNRGPP